MDSEVPDGAGGSVVIEGGAWSMAGGAAGGGDGGGTDGDGGRSAKPAWAGRPPEPGSERERLLDAAAACVARDGVVATGVAAVASEAGVSRPTVYRYFRDRDELLNATFARASTLLAERHAAHVARFVHAGDMAVESIVFMLGELGRDEVLGPLFRAQFELGAHTVRSFTSAWSLRTAMRGLQPLREAAGWDDAEMLEVTEILTRAVLAFFVSAEPERTRQELRSFIERRVLPGLGLSPGNGEQVPDAVR